MAEPDPADIERAAAFVRERLTPGANWTLELARLIAEVRDDAETAAIPNAPWPETSA